MVFFLVVIVLVIGVLLDGFALQVLWGWFMVPTFSLPQLTLAQAIGISLIAHFVTWQHVDCKSSSGEPFEKFRDGMTLILVRSVMVLIFGWIAHQFM